MSTAEQIIADSLKALGAIDYAYVAAHVVAALTNAGKAIVELPDGESVEGGAATAWRIAPDRDFIAGAMPGRLVALDVEMTPGEARQTAASILAAARVAEGGEVQ